LGSNPRIGTKQWHVFGLEVRQIDRRNRRPEHFSLDATQLRRRLQPAHPRRGSEEGKRGFRAARHGEVPSNQIWLQHTFRTKKRELTRSSAGSPLRLSFGRVQISGNPRQALDLLWSPSFGLHAEGRAVNHRSPQMSDLDSETSKTL
jgi:hypothetical protein